MAVAKHPKNHKKDATIEHYTKKLDKVIEINESQIQDHLGELVRGIVEETLNAMLDAESDNLCNAARYERTEARKDTRGFPPLHHDKFGIKFIRSTKEKNILIRKRL